MKFENQRKHEHATLGMIAAAVLMPLGIAQAQTNIWFVDDSVSTSGDGTSWTESFDTLEKALNNMSLNAGDTIRVGQGIYAPTFSFVIDKDVNIRGGYFGLEAPDVPQRDDRDVITHETILTGDTFHRLSGQGTQGTKDSDFTANVDNWKDSTRDDNLAGFIQVANVSEDGVLDGFIIEGGRSQELLGQDFSKAGAMTIVNSSIHIVRCTFRFNSTGKPFVTGDPVISGQGGAVSVSGRFNDIAEDEPAQFINCTFQDNVASSGGAVAVLPRQSSTIDEKTLVTFVNCLIHDNRAVDNTVGEPATPKPFEGTASAIFVFKGAQADIVNCTITQNHSRVPRTVKLPR